MVAKPFAALILSALYLAAESAEAWDAATSAGVSLAHHEDESVALLQHRSTDTQVRARISTAQADANRSAWERRPRMKDVRAAFRALDKATGVVLRAGIGNVPLKGYDRGYMPYSEHFQSVQRMQGSSVLYLAGSGSTAHSGQVFVLDMASRSKVGAMGSNVRSSNKPPTEDVLRVIMNIDNEYWHAGGMSSYDDILVVGCEPGCSVTERVAGGCKTAGRIHFFDTSNPLHPTRLPILVEREGSTAGTSSLTRQDNGKYLLAVGGVDAKQVDFYESRKTTITDVDPEKASEYGFDLVTTWNYKSLLVDAGTDSSYGAYQTMNFVTQDDGSLFLVGLYRSMKGLGSDYADLFKVDATAHGITLTKQANINLKCVSGTCNFQAAAGIYVASPELMLLYAGDWEPDGKEHTITVNEFRPAHVGVGGMCERITPGTCKWSSCSASRGPTSCIDKQCVCLEGYCHQNGKCVADS